MTDFATFRCRLIALRADALRQLAASDQIESAWLSLIAGINAALAALDAEPADAEPANRVVIVDSAEEIKLVSYSGSTAVACLAITGQRAVHLAGQLIAAAARRWPS